MDKIIELETEGLKLRQWLHDDYEVFSRINADPDVMEYYPNILILEKLGEAGTGVVYKAGHTKLKTRSCYQISMVKEDK